MKLIDAINKGNVDLALELISKEDVNLKDKYGCAALYYASEKGYLDVVDRLITQGAKIDEQNILGGTALMRAVIKGHSKVAGKLLDAKANPNIVDKDGYTSMHRAALGNDLTMVKLLADHRGDIGAKTNSEHTIMHCAAVGVTEVSEDWELIKWLLVKGIAPNPEDSSGISVKDTFFQRDYSYAEHYKELVSFIVGDIAEID